MITEEMLHTAAGEVSTCMLHSLPTVREHDFSRKFRQKMKYLQFRTDHPVSHALTACVAVFLAVLTAFTTVMTASPTARANVLEWVKSVYYGVAVYSYEGQMPVQDRNVYYLSQIPEGYTPTKTDELPDGKWYFYQDGAGNWLTFMYIYGSDSVRYFHDTRNCEAQTVPLGSGTAEVYLPNTSYDAPSIVWTDTQGDVLFGISFHGNIEELIALAESVKKQ